MLLVSLLTIGHYRIKKTSSKLEILPTLRIVQPNIAQEKKWAPSHQRKNLHTLLSLSYQNQPQSLQLFIWPESALTLPPTDRVLKYITSPLKKGQYLITGSIIEKSSHIYNGLIILDHLGTIIAHYDKHHLVPFGEYIPFHTLLNKLSPYQLKSITHIKTKSGDKPKTISLPGISSFSPQICFESLFNSLIAYKPKKPQWILNLSNDAWFGDSAGPQQHLSIARFRAIEANLPLVRATSTGVSALIDAHGRIIKKCDYNQKGILDI
jgi:apolipoprotein N-acyltransferase